MKVNVNPTPEKGSEKKPASEKKSKFQKKSPASAEHTGENENSVYRESLAAYREKWAGSNGILHRNRFWLIVTGILLFLSVAVNTRAGNTRMQLKEQLRRVESEISSLNGVIEEVKNDLEEQARIEAAKLTDEEEELARNNAEAQGAHVAYLQNEYGKINVDDPSFSEKMSKNKTELELCFDDNGSANGAAVWYPYYDSGVFGNWEFVTTAPFYGNTAQMLWLCYADDPERPQDHSLLAYCTADYNAEDRLFTNVDIKTTRYADINGGTDPEYVDATEMSIQDQLKALKTDVNTPNADEPFDPETVDINNEVSETRKSYKDAAADGELEDEEYDSRHNVGLGGSSDESETDKNGTDETTDNPDSDDTAEENQSDDVIEENQSDDTSGEGV